MIGGGGEIQRRFPHAHPGCLMMVTISRRGTSVKDYRNTSDTAALGFILAVPPPSPGITEFDQIRSEEGLEHA